MIKIVLNLTIRVSICGDALYSFPILNMLSIVSFLSLLKFLYRHFMFFKANARDNTLAPNYFNRRNRARFGRPEFREKLEEIYIRAIRSIIITYGEHIVGNDGL